MKKHHYILILLFTLVNSLVVFAHTNDSMSVKAVTKKDRDLFKGNFILEYNWFAATSIEQIKWKVYEQKFTQADFVKIFIDTKNYSTAGNMFKDLSQFKSYLKQINNFDEMYFIQQGGRGVTELKMTNRLKNAIDADIDDVFETIWNNTNLRESNFPNLTLKESFEIFKQSIKNKNSKIFETILVTK